MEIGPVKHKNDKSSRCTTWKQFYDRAMEIVVYNPTIAKFVMKYISVKHRFVLRVSDGQHVVSKKCNPDEQFEQIQKFSVLVARALTNQSEKKLEVNIQNKSKNRKKNKNKK